MSKQEYEEKKQQKEEKKTAKQKAQKIKQIKKAITWTLIVVGVPVALYWIVTISVPAQEDLTGELHPSQGAEHISFPWENPPYEWNTNPPTAGWHDPTPLGRGFYEEPQDFPPMIHSLEHGAVIIYYKSSISDEEKAQLRSFWDENSNLKLLITPYDDMDNNYALTAWEWLDTFDEYDEDRIDLFIRHHYDNGPEQAPIDAHR